jgi:uncharacterized protein (DUF342 family)
MSKEREGKHTPGPWKIKYKHRSPAIYDKNNVLITTPINKDWTPNAVLIAKAPEMAEEIQQLKSQIEQHKDKIAQLCDIVAKKTEVIDKQHKRIGELEEESRRLNEKK